ncbi:MAG: TerB family tellurite resistance protein [Gammaproteobacteria bacterium]|nr:TerB family tellurite resistance protein [Gammaproteobacteria bacterium]
MFKHILDWFKNSEATPQPSNDTERATAALMVEVALADDSITQDEKLALPEVLKAHTGLTTQECVSLIETAEQEVDHAVSLHQFTSHLNSVLSLEEKLELTTRLWRISLADDHIDKYEEHTIRKIADLLHLRHSEFMQCKQIALNAHE